MPYACGDYILTCGESRLRVPSLTQSEKDSKDENYPGKSTLCYKI